MPKCRSCSNYYPKSNSYNHKCHLGHSTPDFGDTNICSDYEEQFTIGKSIGWSYDEENSDYSNSSEKDVPKKDFSEPTENSSTYSPILNYSSTSDTSPTNNIVSFVSSGMFAIIFCAVIAGAGWVLINGYQAINNFIDPPPDKRVWEEIKQFSYTPNVPDYTVFEYTIKQDGLYRPVCVQGYTQHNFPTSREGYTKYIPCKGAWIPNTSKKIPRHNTASQLIYINRTDLSGGKMAIRLKKGDKIHIFAMPNIGMVRDTKQTLESLFHDNTGKVKISFQRLIDTNE